MAQIQAPRDTQDLAEIIGGAAARGTSLAIRGGGSKGAIGAPQDGDTLDMRGFAGVTDYDPAELVLTVGAGTPLAQIEALVAEAGQMLAFDPWDHGAMLGGAAGTATIGGVVAAGIDGPQRLTMGAPRDHLLGFEAVSGRGERFIAGGKVVKNVTGYDLAKLMAGSWGRLAAMTQITLKILPRPRMQATLALGGLSPAEAIRAMTRALGSQAEVAAAAHLPEQDGRGLTLLRLQGFEPSVAARLTLLRGLLGGGEIVVGLEADVLWSSVREAAPLRDAPVLWRACLPPSRAAEMIAALAPTGMRWLLDWAGGLAWLAGDADASLVRDTLARLGGHAALIRAPEAMRRTVPAQHPRLPGVAALEMRVRRAFDPAGVFETGRFLDQPDAH